MNKSLSSTKKIISLLEFPLIPNKFIEWQLYEKKSIHEDKARLEIETSVILRTGELNSDIHLTLLAHKDTVHLWLFFFNKCIFCMQVHVLVIYVNHFLHTLYFCMQVHTHVI